MDVFTHYRRKGASIKILMAYAPTPISYSDWGIDKFELCTKEEKEQKWSVRVTNEDSVATTQRDRRKKKPTTCIL